MNVFSALSPAEKARQLGNPDGEVGIAVAEWLNGNNRVSNAAMLANLALEPDCRVLEIGFGNGRVAAALIEQMPTAHYAGIDISPTMVAEASRFNAALVAAGRANFHLGSAERLPFADASFDRAFSLGVIHFWAEPVTPLKELRRVMRRGALSIMGAIEPRSANEFTRPEFGFHLRDVAEWEALYRAAGFTDVVGVATESEQSTPEGTPMKRYGVRVTART